MARQHSKVWYRREPRPRQPASPHSTAHQSGDSPLSPSLAAEIEEVTRATLSRQRGQRWVALGGPAGFAVLIGLGLLYWASSFAVPPAGEAAGIVAPPHGVISRFEVFFNALTEPHLLHEFIRDVGIAFLVAAFAVCGHELIRVVAKVDEEWNHLRTASLELEISRATMNAVAHYDASKAIPELLKTRFPAGLADTLNEVVDSMAALSDSARLRQTADVDYMVQLLNEGVVANAKQLAAFRRGDRSCRFTPLDSREVAAWLLTSELDRLGSGDSYDSVANLITYSSGRLLGYQTKALERAFDAGVCVRRIFNLSGLEKDEYFAKSKFVNAQRATARHLNLVDRFPGRYQVRFLGRQVFEANVLSSDANFDLNAVDNRHLKQADEAFFGIYHQRSITEGGCTIREARSTLVISLHSRSMSPLELRKSEPESASSRAFDVLWNDWAVSANPFEGKNFRAELLARAHAPS